MFIQAGVSTKDPIADSSSVVFTTGIEHQGNIRGRGDEDWGSPGKNERSVV